MTTFSITYVLSAARNANVHIATAMGHTEADAVLALIQARPRAEILYVREA